MSIIFKTQEAFSQAAANEWARRERSLSTSTASCSQIATHHTTTSTNGLPKTPQSVTSQTMPTPSRPVSIPANLSEPPNLPLSIIRKGRDLTFKELSNFSGTEWSHQLREDGPGPSPEILRTVYGNPSSAVEALCNPIEVPQKSGDTRASSTSHSCPPSASARKEGSVAIRRGAGKMSLDLSGFDPRTVVIDTALVSDHDDDSSIGAAPVAAKTEVIEVVSRRRRSLSNGVRKKKPQRGKARKVQKLQEYHPSGDMEVLPALDNLRCRRCIDKLREGERGYCMKHQAEADKIIEKSMNQIEVARTEKKGNGKK